MGALEEVGRDGGLEGDLGRRDGGGEEGEVGEGGGLGDDKQRRDLRLLEEMGGELDDGEEGGNGKGRMGNDEDLQCSFHDETVRIDAECDSTYVIEGESLQRLLEVDDSTLVAGSRKEGEEAVRDLAADGLQDEVLERPSGELVVGDLALEGLEVAVNGEDAVAEELTEDSVVVGALDIVGEVGGEEVLEVEEVGGADPAGEAEEGVDLGPPDGAAEHERQKKKKTRKGREQREKVKSEEIEVEHHLVV